MIIISFIVVQLSGDLFFLFPFGIPIFSGLFFILMCLISYFRRRKRYPEIYAELKRQKDSWLSTRETGRICPSCGNNVAVSIYICPSSNNNSDDCF